MTRLHINCREDEAEVLQSSSSVLTETNLKAVLTLDAFNTKLTADERSSLLALLPQEDRENINYLFTSNPHFQQSIDTYKNLLKMGMFDPQMKDYLSISMESQWRRKDPWKVGENLISICIHGVNIYCLEKTLRGLLGPKAHGL